MKLSPAEKAERERERQIHECMKIGTANYRNRKVVVTFQAMIRAEAAARPAGYYPAIRRGVIAPIYRSVGECVCITCSDVWPWKGSNKLDCGHFCSRKDQGVLFDEENVSPQCKFCNRPPGRPQEFGMWMAECRGLEVIERLQDLKRKSVSFSRDELVDKRIEYSRRLKAAEAKMKGL